MVSVDVQEFPDRHEITGGHKLLEGLKAGASRDWWPTLRKLQCSREKAGPGSDRHGPLIARWTELGTTLGFSEEKEHSRHEREKRRHCSWEQCEYHRDRLASSELKVCRGCGESRYCGQPCQKRCETILHARYRRADSGCAVIGREEVTSNDAND